MNNRYWLPSFDEEGHFFQWCYLSNVTEIRPRLAWEDDRVEGSIQFFNEPYDRLEWTNIDVVYFVDERLVSRKLQDWGLSYKAVERAWTRFTHLLREPGSRRSFSDGPQYLWDPQCVYTDMFLDWLFVKEVEFS